MTLKDYEKWEKKALDILDWVSKEVSIQSTEHGIKHLKDQIICYIIPEAKERLRNSHNIMGVKDE